MPSPFPGMNPYLERASVWSDFHSSFIIGMRDVIAPQVAPAYYLRVSEHVYVHEWPIAVGLADIAVAEQPIRGSRKVKGQVATAEASTSHAIVEYPAIEEERVGFLEIHERSSRRVVTIIELLSRSNKYSGP